ncbi:MAG: hypothetical protein PHQ42_01890 [Patescibacteria group bacterium]|nr:hypothetical protein [Patescibacteria group bacterium]
MKRIYFAIFSFFLLIAAVLTADFFSLLPNAAAGNDAVTITVKISVCGNGIREYGEQCDGSDLGGETCSSRGFTSGTLKCDMACDFDTSDCYTSSASPPASGGSAYVPPAETGVVFSGRAYPTSLVTILKDAQIAATTIADPNANFNVSFSGLSAGSFVFSIYSEDKAGRRSSLFTFPITVTSGTVINVGGIFISPTIAVDKEETKKGDNVAIFGQTAAESEVTISINSEEEFFVKTPADKNGVYLYNFDTSLLEIGQHFTKSKSALSGEISPYSRAVSFLVGTKSVFPPSEKCGKADLNCDGRVNLVDFSIAAYWYKRPISDAFKEIEKERLNGDGKIDLVDFSIMAYYWTG